MMGWIKKRLASPAVAAGRLRFAPQWDFVRARLSRSSDAGLRLTLSVLLFIAATWLFAGVAEDVVTGDPLIEIDQEIMRWFQGHRTAGLTRWMLQVTDAHDTVPITALGLAFAVYLAWRRVWAWVISLVLVLPVGMLINVLLKQTFQRSRPVLDEPLLALATYSFPSGHVAAATLFYGLLAAFLASRTPKLGRRVGLYATAGFMVLLVGTTRIYLGAHYFSDVVAAAAWSTAWLILCLALLAPEAKSR